MITIVTGYPGSGKSTYARSQADARGVVVVDLDAIVSALTEVEAHSVQPDMRIVLAVNDCIWQIAEACDARGLDAYIIRTAPSEAEFSQHGKYCARVCVNTPREVCRSRCELRSDFDADKFARACERVDEFMRLHGNQFRKVSGVECTGKGDTNRSV